MRYDVYHLPADLGDLPYQWKAKADVMREQGLEAVARAYEHCARELQGAYDAWQLEELTLREAADESGYSYSSIQRMVAEGEIPNAGEEGSPRVRRADLPRKPGLGHGGDDGKAGKVFKDV